MKYGYSVRKDTEHGFVLIADTLNVRHAVELVKKHEGAYAQYAMYNEYGNQVLRAVPEEIRKAMWNEFNAICCEKTA